MVTAMEICADLKCCLTLKLMSCLWQLSIVMNLLSIFSLLPVLISFQFKILHLGWVPAFVVVVFSLPLPHLCCPPHIPVRRWHSHCWCDVLWEPMKNNLCLPLLCILHRRHPVAESVEWCLHWLILGTEFRVLISTIYKASRGKGGFPQRGIWSA